jgi:hypothetical protein
MRQAMKLLGIATLASAAMRLPLPALAAVCEPTDPADIIALLNESGAPYAAIYGDLYFSGDFAPVEQSALQDTLPADEAMSAALIGTDLVTGEPFNRAIRMERVCAGIWCGGGAPGNDLLVIIENPQTDPVLRLGPCPDRALANVDEEARGLIRKLIEATP